MKFAGHFHVGCDSACRVQRRCPYACFICPVGITQTPGATTHCLWIFSFEEKGDLGAVANAPREIVREPTLCRRSPRTAQRGQTNTDSQYVLTFVNIYATVVRYNCPNLFNTAVQERGLRGVSCTSSTRKLVGEVLYAAVGL